MPGFGYPLQKYNLTATTSPTVNEDIDDDYQIGSLWVDVTNDKAYTCTDNARGAAVWKQSAPSGSGTVTSVAITGPSIVSWAGSPIATSGTFTGTLVSQNAKTVLAGPATGSAATPTFRQLSAQDLSSRWEPLANGDPASPALVFSAGGDVIMVEVAF